MIRGGDRVLKDGGDYKFEGQVVAVFYKRSGQVRIVVENDAGILHIFSEPQLQVLIPTESRAQADERT